MRRFSIDMGIEQLRLALPLARDDVTTERIHRRIEFFQQVKAVVSLRLLNTTDPFELRFDDIGWKTAEYEPWMPKLKDPSELFGEKR